jgi:hypothetical protein
VIAIAKSPSLKDSSRPVDIAAVDLLDHRKEIAARLLAPVADLGADPAVLVMPGVSLALLGTGATCCRARLDRCSAHAGVRLGLPRHDATSRLAEVRAVEAEANAADQVRDGFLSKARVRAARAGRRTVEALVDAPQEHLTIEARRPRMHFDHSSNCHLVSSSRE